MRKQSPNVATLSALSERYGMSEDLLLPELEQQEREERLTPHVFEGGVKVWFLVETDGWFVRRERELLGVLQSELAEAWEMSAPNLSYCETGKRAVPEWRLRTLRELLIEIAENRPAEDAA